MAGSHPSCIDISFNFKAKMIKKDSNLIIQVAIEKQLKNIKLEILKNPLKELLK
jgi:hypothetical protein